MQRSLILLGIMMCVVGTFLGIIGTFFYPETLAQYIGLSLVDQVKILSVLGFFSFAIGFLLSISGMVSKRKGLKKTKSISFNRYYNP
jgi:hypothetical protein